MHIVIVRKKVFKKLIVILSILITVSVVIAVFGQSNINTLVTSNKNLPIYNVDTKEKKVAITFDTSWGQDNTSALLDILDKKGVKCTFFIIGRWAEEFPDKTKDILKRGHEIGNHSDKHPDFTKLSSDEMINEVAAADAKILAITGVKPVIFRFPEGTYNDSSVQIVEKTAHKCIQWDVDSIDWKGDGENIEYNRVISKVKPGSIILFHNSAPYTVKTLPRIIDKLKAEGYTFVKVSDLIYNDNYIIDGYGKQIKK